MDILKHALDLFLHLNQHLAVVIQEYGVWTYLLLFLIVFCETGLVVTPFLPGDSLLFSAGALCATSALEMRWLFLVLSLAAILGDTVNYAIGAFLGPKVFEHDRRFLNKQHLQKTSDFYKKYGGKTIIIARFVPIVRTFAPFVAGVGSMNYGKFISYNIIGGLIWVAICLVSGYFFGNLEIVKKNFSLVIIGIIFISILPAVIEYLKQNKVEPKITH